MKPFEDLLDSSESSFSKELFVEAFKYFNQEHGSVSLPMMVGILIDLVEATVATAPVTEADSISISNVTTETRSKRKPKKSTRKGKRNR